MTIDDMPDDPDLSRAARICSNYIIPSVCAFGIVSNILNLIVLSRKHMKESPYSYLRGLAVADVLSLTLVLTKSTISKNLFKGAYAWMAFEGYIYLPIGNTFANASIWITVLLTVERWISVKFPLKAKDICTRSLARKAMFTVFVLSFVANIPRFLCRTIERGEDDVYVLKSTDFEKGRIYECIMWFYIITILFIPLVILATLNTCLVILIYRANRNRNILLLESRLQHEDPNVFREQTRLTVTCISIIVLFLICMTPSAFSSPPVAHALFGNGYDMEEFKKQQFYQLLALVCNTLVTCNLSLNFVMYCMFNNRFTRTLHYLFQDLIHRLTCTRTNQRRASRRSSTSSYMCRHSNHRWRHNGESRNRGRQAPFAQQWNALYFNVDMYPLASMQATCASSTYPRRTPRPYRTELVSQTEFSEL